MILNLSILGWLVSLAVGFGIGGVLFLSMKVEVDYVISGKGPGWLVPAMLYARMAFIAAVLVVLTVSLPHERVAAAALSGLVGVVLARIAVARKVRGGSGFDTEDTENGDESGGGRQQQ
jgi:L-asparagine transporter-like permease